MQGVEVGEAGAPLRDALPDGHELLLAGDRPDVVDALLALGELPELAVAPLSPCTATRKPRFGLTLVDASMMPSAPLANFTVATTVSSTSM